MWTVKKGLRKPLIIILGIVLLLGITACGANTQQASSDNAQNTETSNASNTTNEPLVIKVADSFPTSHLIPKFGTIPWMEKIEERSEGKIKFEYYPAEQLGKATSLLDVVRNEVAHIVYLGPLYISDKLPLSTVAGNPGLVPDALTGSLAYHKLVTEDLYEAELKKHGVKPLWAGTTNPYQIVNSKHPVHTIEDFKGLKIRTSGGIQENVMQAWGAIPVSIPAPEQYTAWERGTIDGTLLSFFSWPGYQTEKVAKYSTTNAALSAFGVMYVVNEKVWNSWPQEVQDVILEVSAEIPEMLAKSIIEEEAKMVEEYKELGIEFYELPPDELERWNKELAPFNEEWAKEQDAKGLPGTEILEKFRQYIEEFSQ